MAKEKVKEVVLEVEEIVEQPIEQQEEVKDFDASEWEKDEAERN